MAAHPIGEIEFDGVRVPAEDRVGAEGEGFRLAMQTMDMFRASVGAAACGMARRALDEAVHYAKTRRQFGVTLAMHQLIQEKLAVMQTELDAARLLVYRAAYLKDTGASPSLLTRAASEAKFYATEAAQRIVDEAVQIHGGAGLVRGSRGRAPLPRRARAAHLRGHHRNPEAHHRPRAAEGVRAARRRGTVRPTGHHMKPISEDTSPEAQRVLLDLTRHTPVWRRLQLTCELVQTTRLLMLADLRGRFPRADEVELRRRLIARMLPREQVVQAFGFDPAEEGY